RSDGIDIEAPAGTAVRAVGKGRVDFTSDDFGSFGQVIVVNHGDGFYTLYGHLSDILVSNGQEVQSGQTIGRVGDTGTSLKPAVKLSELLGQPETSQFLRGVVASGRLCNAYLFHGPPGIGKGTAALAFARAILCERGPAAKDDAEGGLFASEPAPAAVAPPD